MRFGFERKFRLGFEYVNEQQYFNEFQRNTKVFEETSTKVSCFRVVEPSSGQCRD